METKLSKILNKLIDNDENNLSLINKLEIDCNAISASIEKFNGSDNIISGDLTSINNKISEIIDVLSGYTEPNSINNQFQKLSNEFKNSIKVADNSYILVNDNNEIYLDIDKINKVVEDKIDEYDCSLSGIYERLCNLDNNL